MPIKKIEIRPKGTGNYADILYPKTSTDMVIDEATGTTVAVHLADNTKHTTQTQKDAWDKKADSRATSIDADPNTCLETLFLTSHANAPEGAGIYYYIKNMFWTEGVTGNRGQVAYSYHGATPKMRVRHFFSGSWTPWSIDPFQSVVDGKNSVESAIEAKGGTVSDVNNPPTFADLVAGINGLSIGKRYATGSNMSSGGFLAVTGLTFVPTIFIGRAPSLSASKFDYSVVYIEKSYFGTSQNLSFHTSNIGYTETTPTVTSTGITTAVNSTASYQWIAIV